MERHERQRKLDAMERDLETEVSSRLGDFNSRLTRVESGMSAVADMLKRSMQDSDRERASMTHKLDAMQREFMASRATNWPVMIGVGAVALTFTGMVAGLMMFSVKSTVQPINLQAEDNKQRLLQVESKSHENGFHQPDHDRWAKSYESVQRERFSAIEAQLEKQSQSLEKLTDRQIWMQHQIDTDNPHPQRITP